MDDLISRKAALDAISCNITVTGRQNAELVAATIGAFADRIKALPPAQPDVPDMNVGDIISRQAAIDALENVAELYPWRAPGNRDSYSHYNEGWRDAIGRAEIGIEELPSAQPEDWIERNKERILQAGMEGREIEFRIGGRLFAIREKAQ